MIMSSSDDTQVTPAPAGSTTDQAGLFAVTPETAQLPAAQTVPLAIEIKALRKSFGDREVLKGIDIEVPRGSVTVVLGGSGMGKSVLMKHMIGLLKPTSGSVMIDGQDITNLKPMELKAVRSKFGMVFQQAALFDSMTNYDNIACHMREHRQIVSGRASDEKIRVREPLRWRDPYISGPRFPSEIAGGHCKRVGLARAVALDPTIVLYDEPTTGLDPITTDQVDEMILHAKRALGITSIVISHDIASAFNIADQILFVYEGQIVVRGTREMVLASEHPFVTKFFATWAQKNA